MGDSKGGAREEIVEAMEEEQVGCWALSATGGSEVRTSHSLQEEGCGLFHQRMAAIQCPGVIKARLLSS